MRQVFLQKGATVVKEVSRPLLDDYSVLVAVKYSFISSGTEAATIANSQKSVLFSNIPQKIKKVLESVAVNGIDGTRQLVRGRLQGQVQALGYSCSGRVLAVGKKVKNLRAGDMVACAGAGMANHADVVCVPENLAVRVTDEKFLKDASIATIGAIALQGVRRAQLQLGEWVCVTGLGLLGQLTVQLAKRAGCKVIGIDLLKERMDLATEFGADAVFNAAEDDIVKELSLLTGHNGVDATIIAAAAKTDAIVQQAMEVTRKKGRVIVVGDVGLGLERSPLYAKEIDFLISCSYGPGRYDKSYEKEGNDYPYAYVRWTENRNMQAVVDFIQRGELKINTLISREFAIDDAAKAYEAINTKQGLGAVICYANADDLLEPEKASSADVTPTGEVRFMPAVKDELRVGFVGAGGFAKVKLMPIVAGIKKASIKAIVDADVANSINTSRLYGTATALTDDAQLFDDNLVDVVVVASPHKYHCEQALRALRKGKGVFLEKPMVTDFDQFKLMTDFLQQHPTVPFCVDYNRSFAPFMQKIKKHLDKRKTPITAHYRMNAGIIPKDHWVQTEVGAGRIIGEACHIFDLFCYLTDAKPLAVSVEAMHTQDPNLFPTDNFSAQISFDDGSICTLLYTAVGHKQLGKERMELFFDGKAVVMDDYKYLAGYGLPRSFDESTQVPDKGHEELLTKFFASMTNPVYKHPISLERLNTVSNLTLTIDKLACEGGGTKELV